MRTRFQVMVLLIVGLGAMGIASAPDAPAKTSRAGASADAPPTPHRVAEIAAHLPASYDANEGQFDEGVHFVARGGGITAWLLDGEAVLALGGAQPDAKARPSHADTAPKSGGVVRMRFEGEVPRGERRAASRVSYFLGSDTSRWRPDVASFERVRCRAIAPGVDLVWHGTRRALEYDLVVSPGADPSAAAIRFGGAASLRIDPSSGDLLVGTPAGGEMRHSRPRCFQTLDGSRREVRSRFAVDGERVRFSVGTYDRSRELVIDPQITMATYFGSADVPYDAACGPSGDLYFCGGTVSSTLPVLAAYQPQYVGASAYADGYVTRLKSDGSGLVFSTYLGGNSTDQLLGMCVDAQGDVYVVGRTSSTNFPVVSALQSTNGGGSYDACVTKLAGTGTSVAYSTYLGGIGTDSASGAAVDATGALYVAGGTSTTNFPTVNARQPTHAGGGDDAFLTKFAPSGSSLVFSTFHGGSGADYIDECVLDTSGAVYVVGTTTSTNLPTNNALQSTPGAYSDGFIAKYNAAGSALIYATYLGGNGADWFTSVAVDGLGGLYLCGNTNSTDFPTVAPYQGTGAGSYDAFVAKLAPGGNSLSFSSYLGGSDEDNAVLILPDSAGAFVVVGFTASTNFPTMNALQPTYGGGPNETFVARFTGSPPSLAYSTFLGGSGQDPTYAGAIDASGNVFVVTDTTTANRYTVNAFQPAFSGNPSFSPNAYVAKLVPASPTPPSSLNALLAGPSLAQVTWTDASNNETGFEIQRRVNTGAYTSYGTAQPGATSFDDTSLFGGTTYTYRVRALGLEGASAFSNEAAVSTPAGSSVPQPPIAPDRLEALVVSGTEVALAWRDRSNDETLFELQRAVGGAAYVSLKTAPQDSVGLSDEEVLPGWPVSYRVRALAVQGPSSFSAPVTTTTPASVTFTTTSGLVADSAKPKKDRLTWKGTFAFDTTPATPVDPRVLGLRLQAGPRGAPVVVEVPGGNMAWKVKKSKYTWKSAKGVVPKVSVTIDTAKMTYSVKASSFDYAAPAGTESRLLLALGDDAGGITQTWLAQRTAGNFAPPKP